LQDRQRGRVRIMVAKVIGVDLTNRPHARPPRYPTVRVTACLSVSKVHAFGPSGKSIVPRSRLPYFTSHLVLVNFHYPASRSWLVKRVSATEGRSCTA
jgi:hypothetical protein